MIVIVDYGMGNNYSVIKAFNRLGVEVKVSNNSEDILGADKLILPGVGNFKIGISNMKSSGCIKSLEEAVRRNKVPILGICLGAQLLLQHSEEGDVEGLGWIKGIALKFKSDLSQNKIPHVGWNSIVTSDKCKLFKGLPNNTSFYFVHSYYMSCEQEENSLGVTQYINQFDSVVGYENIIGVQFHPEKSHSEGLIVLRNFLDNY